MTASTGKGTTGKASINKVVLSVKGVGWRGHVAKAKTLKGTQEACIVLNVGASHPIIVPIPKKIEVTFTQIDEASGHVITLSGTNKEELNNFAAHLETLRDWNPYTGQGIAKRYAVTPDGIFLPASPLRKVGKRK